MTSICCRQTACRRQLQITLKCVEKVQFQYFLHCQTTVSNKINYLNIKYSEKSIKNSSKITKKFCIEKYCFKKLSVFTHFSPQNHDFELKYLPSIAVGNAVAVACIAPI